MSWKTPLLAAVGTLAAVGAIVLAGRPPEPVPCGPGFTRIGPRCCPTKARLAGDTCVNAPASGCPAPLVATAHGCDAAEDDVVEVPATTVTLGPSDWEAEGRVAPRTVEVASFAIDRLETSLGRLCAVTAIVACADVVLDAARAASGVTFDEARAYCKSRGGRLPTEDEWLAASGGDRPRRYPWGDTGAVCRRAAWGLASGPCARGAKGPDTVGAHSEGQTPLGIHDLAGNVAEWVEAPCPAGAARCPRVVRGGSWRTTLATELRTWLRSEVDGEGRADPAVGFRCAYDLPRR